MIRSLKEQYVLENSNLAPYAIRNTDRSERKYPEEPHPFRTDFQRDRDRILHSRSFRRLEYKSQVFLSGTGDHLRTRLTHTIEVAAIARTISRTFMLNEDLTETIALAHDIGHTPFGHPGESIMNEIMKDEGGFDHNEQSLRTVDILERKYPDYEGLNLTWEVRAGLVKRRNPEKAKLDGEKLPPQPSLESQVADISDDITYYGHDVDDGLDAGMINEKMLDNLEIWNIAADLAAKNGLRKGDKFRAFAVRCLIDMMVKNVVENSERNLREMKIRTALESQKTENRIISFDAKFAKMTSELRKFLFENVYYHPDVATVNDIAAEKIKGLFKAYLENPKRMGAYANSRIPKDGLKRAVADYVIGMTDRFAVIEYKKFCEDKG
ncbi:MAG TPA: deoxyguanosinetriphosphate triphosphohydrolase [Victivallales bacterium]|nr:deoxyguanosinetriphosphate triphosphohydrolase [Victivallales bacterium]